MCYYSEEITVGLDDPRALDQYLGHWSPRLIIRLHPRSLSTWLVLLENCPARGRVILCAWEKHHCILFFLICLKAKCVISAKQVSVTGSAKIIVVVRQVSWLLVPPSRAVARGLGAPWKNIDVGPPHTHISYTVQYTSMEPNCMLFLWFS